MRTAVNRYYHRLDMIHIEERQLPSVQSDEVCIKIHAAGINKADLLLAKGKPWMIRLMYGFTKPKHIYPGSDISGEVIAVGNGVSQFKIGDKVFGELSGVGFGAFAEMVNVKERHIWHIPTGYSHLETAALPMSMGTALEALKKAGDIANKNVLVYGGSGGVGHLLVQLAQIKGAKVDVVASRKHHDYLMKLGVSNIFDYTSSSFALPKHRYDVIFAVNGYQPLKSYSNALIDGGSCIIIGGSGKQLFAAMAKGWFYRIFKKRLVTNVIAKPGQDVLKSISEICQNKKVNVHIGKIYPLDAVSQALIDFEAHTYQGKYIIDTTK